MFNRVILVGRVGTAPERRSAPEKQAMVQFRLGVSRFARDTGEQTDWFTVVFFGPEAERALERLHVGDLVLFEGSLRAERRELPEGTRTRIRLIGRRFRILARGPQHVAPAEEREVPEEISAEQLEDIPPVPDEDELLE